MGKLYLFEVAVKPKSLQKEKEKQQEEEEEHRGVSIEPLSLRDTAKTRITVLHMPISPQHFSSINCVIVTLCTSTWNSFVLVMFS